MSPAARSRRRSVPRRDSDAIVVLARHGEELASWPVWWLGRPTLDAVDELARLQLIARSLGCSIRLRQVGVDLWELLDLVGLRDVLLGSGDLPPEVGGQAEGRE
jgi:hypothetical protein